MMAGETLKTGALDKARLSDNWLFPYGGEYTERYNNEKRGSFNRYRERIRFSGREKVEEFTGGNGGEWTQGACHRSGGREEEKTTSDQEKRRKAARTRRTTRQDKNHAYPSRDVLVHCTAEEAVEMVEVSRWRWWWVEMVAGGGECDFVSGRVNLVVPLSPPNHA